MSRLKNFARGIVSGYVQMAANIVFTLASVPLALNYLPKEEFALWALVTQIAGYFALVDLGMGVSVSRILADHKDDRDGGRYGGVLKAGGIVFCTQGLVIAAANWVFAPALASAFGIGPEWRGEFILLLRGHGLIMAFGFAMKIWGTPFWGFQRYDIGNYSATASFALQLAVLWGGFLAGIGVRSMLIAYAAQSFLTSLWSLVAGLKLGIYPRRGSWGRIEGGMIRELFVFGRDIFLMTLGSQLLTASQIMIVTRLLGLDAAATWAICSKIFTLAQQAVGRILDNSAGAFTEMFVRKEHDRMKWRFRDVTALTASLSVAAGVVGATVNASFVEVWTHGRVEWPLPVDVVLGTLLIVTCVSRCFSGIAGITKEIRLLRFVYFFEGLSFVVLAWFGGARLGFVGIATASVVVTIVWSGLYGFVRTRRQWHCSTIELLGWLAPAGRVLLGLLPTAIVFRWWMDPQPGRWELPLLGGALSLIAAALVWWTGFPPSLKKEFAARAVSRRTAAV